MNFRALEKSIRVLEILFLKKGTNPVKNAIHRINRYLVDKFDKTDHAIHWIVIYLLDSVIQPSNNSGLKVGFFFAFFVCLFVFFVLFCYAMYRRNYSQTK